MNFLFHLKTREIRREREREREGEREREREGGGGVIILGRKRCFH